MISPEQELQLHRYLARLRAKLSSARDAEQAVRSALRETAEFFDGAACLAHAVPGEPLAQLAFGVPAGENWDLELLAQFFRAERPAIPRTTLLAPVHRRGRVWRILALKTLEPDRTFERADHERLSRIVRTLSELIDGIDRERIVEVRSRIGRKIMEELRPKDLFYQILHGLRSLTAYDHSAAVLTTGEQGDSLTLVAEQIAWRKGKSDRVGLRLALDPALMRLMTTGEVFGFDREGGAWEEWTGHRAAELAGLLDYNDEEQGANGGPREAAMLCAPLVARDGVMGVLKIASRHAGSLGEYEVELLKRFMPQAAVAVQNSQRSETLQAKMVEAEKKNAMAHLARGVAHDMNNALGSILPLVQELREDADSGQINPRVLSGDLQEIERSLMVCMRIFGGMLGFARGQARRPGRGDVRRASDNALAILRDGLQRREIRCTLSVPDDLATVHGTQAELDQVFFNLLANARDAMPEGGELTVTARPLDDGVEVRIEDTGIGIPAEDLPRIYEPFFTTRTQGSGLGLSICRSILWAMGGELSVESSEGQGTCVTLTIPSRVQAREEG